MEMLEFVLLLLAAVLVSAVLDQMMPRVSLPLVQIAIGAIVILLVGTPVDVAIDPELFLVLFIAPLPFDESRHASKRGLWDNKGSIVSLAIGLVIVTVLVVGFVLNWIEPSIPLAAAFALGAALGPTDAVAVTALGKDIRLTGRQKSLLSGEALINDASGVGVVPVRHRSRGHRCVFPGGRRAKLRYQLFRRHCHRLDRRAFWRRRL
ncbi:MAG: cation:proton antiporter [Senegalimassilia faecalis]